MKKVTNYIIDYSIHLAIFTIFFIQILFLTINFVIYKDGFHSDELWSYGFACSSKGVDIYADPDDNLINFNEWLASSILYDYITIDKSEILDYASVYNNSVDDYHPPFYFFILHFVCSLFLGKFSMYYAYFIAVVFFLIQQLFSYKLIKVITNNEAIGLIGVFFLGFTTASEDIVFFLRMYGPGAAFAVMLLYYTTLLFNQRNNKTISKSTIVKLILTTIAGSLTVHIFLIFAFGLSLIFSIYYIFSKKIKLGLIYGFSMLSSALLALAIFPATISQLFGNTGTFGDKVAKYPFWFQFKLYFYYLTQDLFGIGKYPYKTMTLEYILLGIFIFFFFFIPFCFIFRNESWLKKMLKTIKNYITKLIKSIKPIHFSVIAALLSSLFIIGINAEKTSIFHMGRLSSRYIMIIYPVFGIFAITAFAYILNWLISSSKAKAIISLVFACTFAILSISLAPHSYRNSSSHEGKSLDELEANSNCIAIYSSEFLLTCSTYNVGKTDHFFATNYDLAMNMYYSSDIDFDSAPLYLLFDVTRLEYGDFSAGGIDFININITSPDLEYSKEDYLDFYKSLDFVTKCELVGTDYNLFGRKVEIYRLN